MPDLAAPVRRIGCVCDTPDACCCDLAEPRQGTGIPHDPAACRAYAEAQGSLRSVACPGHWLSDEAAELRLRD